MSRIGILQSEDGDMFIAGEMKNEDQIDRYDVIGAILDRPTAEKFREMCKPNTAEDVIETFIRNVIKSGVTYEAEKGGE